MARTVVEPVVERVVAGCELFKQVMLGQGLGDEGVPFTAAARGAPRRRDAGAARSAVVARRAPPRAGRRTLIKVVYGELLPRVPLRFLLADDPGAGKTVMAGQQQPPEVPWSVFFGGESGAVTVAREPAG